MGVCNCSMFCCTLLYVHSSFAIILKVKRKLVALLSLSSLRLVIDVWLFLTVSYVCLQFVIVVFPDHTHLLFLTPGARHILLLVNKLSSIFRFHYTVMQFPIHFNVGNTQGNSWVINQHLFLFKTSEKQNKQ